MRAQGSQGKGEMETFALYPEDHPTELALIILSAGLITGNDI